MLYEYNGRLITESELEYACKLYTAFQVGEIKSVNLDKAVAEAIMEGKSSYAVTLLATANGIKRIDARKFLEKNGKRICCEYVNNHNITTVNAAG